MDSFVTRTQLERAVLAGMDRACERPMQWGVDDCALWVADILKEAFGRDFAAKFRGRYQSRRGAMRVLGRGGLLKAVRTAARSRRWKRIHPSGAKPGDVGLAWTLFEGKPVLATAVCRAPGWFVARNERGFSAVPADKVAVTWSVLDDYEPATRRGLPRLSKPWEPPTSAVCHEPVSTGVAILSLLGITGAPTLVAGAVGAIALTGISAGVSISRSNVRAQ